MEEPNPNPNPNSNTASTTPQSMSQSKQQLFQQQLYLLHQYQQHQKQQHQSQSSQLQAAMSRFPSNIDAHLRPPGMRSQGGAAAAAAAAQTQPQVAVMQQKVGMGRGGGSSVEVEMAHQDAMKVCNPDVKTPFASVEDAVNRLLPYHVVCDFEAEEDDRILDSDTTGQVPSRLQQWDHNILAKIAEFTTTFEKQVLAFNIMSRKRKLGEFRAEERLMIEQALLQEEKQALLDLRSEIDMREKANREAAEVKMRMAMAQAEQARAEAQAHAEMMARPLAPMRASAIGSHSYDGAGGSQQGMGTEQGGDMDEMIHGWGSGNNNNGQREDEEPSEDFLNDENDPENGEEGGSQEDFDLNTR